MAAQQTDSDSDTTSLRRSKRDKYPSLKVQEIQKSEQDITDSYPRDYSPLGDSSTQTASVSATQLAPLRIERGRSCIGPQWMSNNTSPAPAWRPTHVGP